MMDNNFTDARRPELEGLDFKTFFVCNYFRPELPKCSSTAFKVGLAALSDPDFPRCPASVDEIGEYVRSSFGGKFRPYRVLSKAFHEYRSWVSGVKSVCSGTAE